MYLYRHIFIYTGLEQELLLLRQTHTGPATPDTRAATPPPHTAPTLPPSRHNNSRQNETNHAICARLEGDVTLGIILQVWGP